MKLEIADILINMADKALYTTKTAVCNVCKFGIIDKPVFMENICPECSSIKITTGKNKTVYLKLHT